MPKAAATFLYRRICSSRPGDGDSADRVWQLSQLVEGVLTAFNPSHGSLFRRGRRARRARFPTCGVVRVAGYSVVWDCDPPQIFLKSTKRSAAAIFGRSAPSLRFMVRFGIFCCRQDFLLCFT